jgi:hypothetical protein
MGAPTPQHEDRKTLCQLADQTRSTLFISSS